MGVRNQRAGEGEDNIAWLISLTRDGSFAHDAAVFALRGESANLISLTRFIPFPALQLPLQQIIRLLLSKLPTHPERQQLLQLCFNKNSDDTGKAFLGSDNRSQSTDFGGTESQNNEIMESWLDCLNLLMNTADGVTMGSSLQFHNPFTQGEEESCQFTSLWDFT
ncbi:hypothetical protein SUGI_1080670 [Cryptomeria japonica]|nr:hypothetical protein SUGI_1080670 [Cryptomeria japonica]